MKKSDYDENLMCKTTPSIDIVEIREMKSVGDFKNWKEAKVIWSREAINEMTLEEIEKALGKKIKIVAK